MSVINYLNFYVNYVHFFFKLISFISSVFTQEKLELTPTAKVLHQELFRVPKPGTIDWNNASKDHMDLYKAAMERIRHRVENRRILCHPVFHDFDRYFMLL